MATDRTIDEALLAQCPVRDGFRQRGHEITRVEVLTDTAFAFAVTMLVISLNDVPRSWQELIDGLKQLPALAASFLHIVMFWYGHVKWSRRFGLEDLPTIWLSAALVFVMLVFVYFLRLMFSSAFAWATNGWLPSEMEINSVFEVRWLFILYGSGFFLMSVLIGLLNLHALRQRASLALDALEIYHTRVEIAAHAVLAATALASVILSAILPGAWLSLAGAIYGTLGLSMPLLAVMSERRESQKGKLVEEEPLVE